MSAQWTKKKFLVCGTTYPEFSKTYYETVCTIALDADTGRLIRVYPVTLRHMAEPFHSYQWIEVDAEKNPSDFRPESFHVRQDTIKLGEKIDTKDGWAARARWVLASGNVFPSVEALVAAEANDHTSMGLVQPKNIKRVYVRRKPDSERTEWEEHREKALSQRDLFVDAESKTKDLMYMPVQYRIEFSCAGAPCKGHDMGLLDWGIYVLSRRQYAARGAAMAERDVIDKINECLDPAKKDAYLFLGNTLSHCRNFMVLGLFYPPKRTQTVLPGLGL